MSVGALLAALDAAPSHAAVLRTARALDALTPDARGPAAPIKLALVSSFTIQPLVPYLTVECARLGVAPAFHVSQYGEVEPDLLTPGGALDAFAPDLTFVALGLDGLLPRAGGNVGAAHAEVLDRLVHLVTSYRARARGTVVVHNFVTPPASPSDAAGGLDTPPHAFRRLNLALAERLDGQSGILVFDMDAAVADHGRARSRPDTRYYLAAMELAESLLPALAHRYAAYVKAALGRTRKCLVLDCDDTLWGGIVGEEGVDGVKLAGDGLGRAFRDLQDYALVLHRRGVLLALCSKNDAQDVDAMLAQHPHMAIRAEHLAALRVNWQDKATNLREIAAELSIGLDSLVFLDDNPVERAQVRQALPQVLVPELPADPALRPRFLAQLNDFASLTLTAEDAARGAYYAQERQRRGLETSSQSLEEFLHTLELTLRITCDDPDGLPRLAQLAARTNQFNLTTRRHPEAAIARMIAEPTHRVYAARAADRFGDNGLIALVIAACAPDAWTIDTLLMSCRVIGRGIETALLARVAADASVAGATRLRGEYVPSAKNAQVAVLYARHGFARTAEPAPGHTLWERGLPGDPQLTVPAWIRLA